VEGLTTPIGESGSSSGRKGKKDNEGSWGWGVQALPFSTLSNACNNSTYDVNSVAASIIH